MRIDDRDYDAELVKYLEGSDMNWSQGGNFTRNLLSLQLQLQTLLEGVGGEGTASLLDGLSQLSESERKRILPILSRVVGKVLKGEKRLSSAEDRDLQNFEDSLFDSIMLALGQSANDDQIEEGAVSRKLEIVPGGRDVNSKDEGSGALARERSTRKPVKVPSTIDLAKARENRRHKFDVPPNQAG
jgi:hypothetical protein